LNQRVRWLWAGEPHRHRHFRRGASGPQQPSRAAQTTLALIAARRAAVRRDKAAMQREAAAFRHRGQFLGAQILVVSGVDQLTHPAHNRPAVAGP
jgi:hypothetical protein